ncbi:antitoxin [Streptomyces tropicalis]|uniref:Rv0909 family putative TA system antitoxin n=1 Tax=Streptomyces tropicalis TaxID=3034234 RepID=A0ABT6AE66_9ACTN|nr:Rv0909 family putative TA system antitoxin [Streptomyces tropicalis]MDF3302631.1 Rv0909 family putative TA system antitoxin [Streptomyces tropicalis]
MSLRDEMKAGLDRARHTVADLAHRHEDRIGHGLDRAAEFVDARTGGKYGTRLQAGAGKAKEAVARLAHEDERDTGPARGTDPSGAAPGTGSAGSRPGGGPTRTPPSGDDTAPRPDGPGGDSPEPPPAA